MSSTSEYKMCNFFSCVYFFDILLLSSQRDGSACFCQKEVGAASFTVWAVSAQLILRDPSRQKSRSECPCCSNASDKILFMENGRLHVSEAYIWRKLHTARCFRH